MRADDVFLGVRIFPAFLNPYRSHQLYHQNANSVLGGEDDENAALSLSALDPGLRPFLSTGNATGTPTVIRIDSGDDSSSSLEPRDQVCLLILPQNTTV